MEILSLLLSGSGLMGISMLLVLSYGMFIAAERSFFFRKHLNPSSLVPLPDLSRAIRFAIDKSHYSQDAKKPFIAEFIHIIQQLKTKDIASYKFESYWSQLMKEHLSHAVDARVRTVRRLGQLSANMGMLGTCAGIMLALSDFGHSDTGSQKEIFSNVMTSVSLAFSTTLLGLLSQTVLNICSYHLERLQQDVMGYLRLAKAIIEKDGPRLTQLKERKSSRTMETKGSRLQVRPSDVNRVGTPNTIAVSDITSRFCL